MPPDEKKNKIGVASMLYKIIKPVLMGFGIVDFVMWVLPSQMTAIWFGVSGDTMIIVDTLYAVKMVICFGGAGIISVLENKE